LPYLGARGMMRRMHEVTSAPPRVIVYVFASPQLVGSEDAQLLADVEKICAEEGVVLVDSIVDRGPPKSPREHYPVLARLQRGDADLLLIVRSPFYRRGDVADALESCCAEGPFGWLSKDDLRRADLLPPARTSIRRRPRVSVRSRARALRAQGLDLRRIGQTLAAEGYGPPAGARWTAGAVAKLLGMVLMKGGQDPAIGLSKDAGTP
jgi:hypothetical protein